MEQTKQNDKNTYLGFGGDFNTQRILSSHI